MGSLAGTMIYPSHSFVFMCSIDQPMQKKRAAFPEEGLSLFQAPHFQHSTCQDGFIACAHKYKNAQACPTNIVTQTTSEFEHSPPAAPTTSCSLCGAPKRLAGLTQGTLGSFVTCLEKMSWMDLAAGDLCGCDVPSLPNCVPTMINHA